VNIEEKAKPATAVTVNRLPIDRLRGAISQETNLNGQPLQGRPGDASLADTETFRSIYVASDIKRLRRTKAEIERIKATIIDILLQDHRIERWERQDRMRRAPPPCTTRVDGGSQLRLRGLVRTVVRAAEGQRDEALFWAACWAGEAMRDGTAARDFVFDVLVEAAAVAGLGRLQAERTIKSVLRTGGGS
jgi:hypothetical protein